MNYINMFKFHNNIKRELISKYVNGYFIGTILDGSNVIRILNKNKFRNRIKFN